MDAPRLRPLRGTWSPSDGEREFFWGGVPRVGPQDQEAGRPWANFCNPFGIFHLESLKGLLFHRGFARRSSPTLFEVDDELVAVEGFGAGEVGDGGAEVDS